MAESLIFLGEGPWSLYPITRLSILIAFFFTKFQFRSTQLFSFAFSSFRLATLYVTVIDIAFAQLQFLLKILGGGLVCSDVKSGDASLDPDCPKIGTENQANALSFSSNLYRCHEMTSFNLHRETSDKNIWIMLIKGMQQYFRWRFQFHVLKYKPTK